MPKIVRCVVSLALGEGFNSARLFYTFQGMLRTLEDVVHFFPARLAYFFQTGKFPRDGVPSNDSCEVSGS